MFNWIKKWFKKEQESVPLLEETPKQYIPQKYSKDAYKAYFELVPQHDLKGRRVIVRFYSYDGKSPVVEEVVEDNNPETLKRKVDRLIEQRMSKQRR